MRERFELSVLLFVPVCRRALALSQLNYATGIFEPVIEKELRRGGRSPQGKSQEAVIWAIRLTSYFARSDSAIKGCLNLKSISSSRDLPVTQDFNLTVPKSVIIHTFLLVFMCIVSFFGTKTELSPFCPGFLASRRVKRVL